MKRFGLSLLAFAGMLLGVATASAQHNHAKHHGDEELCSEATKAFAECARKGFQQPHNPQFVFTTPNNKFMLGVGATVTLRTS